MIHEYNNTLPTTGKILVDFYANWCGPCKVMGKILEDIKDIDIYKINVDTFPDFAEKFNVRNLPTLVCFEDDKEIWRHTGVLTKEVILDKLK